MIFDITSSLWSRNQQLLSLRKLHMLLVLKANGLPVRCDTGTCIPMTSINTEIERQSLLILFA